MSMKYRVVFIIVFLLMALSTSLSYMNYIISLESTHERLKSRSLPLSTDNIYTEVQKNIIEPNLIGSMMAEDTFLKDWLLTREQNSVEDIREYLEAIKNKYGMLETFLASDETKNYYTSKGFVETMKEDNPTNGWYYSFKKSSSKNEINLDHNEHINNTMIMFINHKIYDSTYNIIGATGVAYKTSYIDDMLKKFRIDYSFNVFFIDKDGNLVLYERDFNNMKNISDSEVLTDYKDEIINKKDGIIKIKSDTDEYLVNVKYIDELNLYLIVEAKMSTFTQEVRRVFYINLLISILITTFVTLIILNTINRYNKRLEHMASHDSLTNLPNRRSFNDAFKKLMLLHDRQKNNLSLLFFDIDDFKKINDTAGHQVGDEVLVRIAEITRECIRQTDLTARWGGEEFIVALIDSSFEDSEMVANKLRESIESDKKLENLIGHKITASFGLTEVEEHDKTAKVIQRVDDAMYKAKNDGKNRVVIF